MPSQFPKIALVSGAAKRLGKAMALALADDGYDVCIHYNNSQKAAEEVATLISSKGQKSAVLAGDLTCETTVSTLINRAAEMLHAPVTLLINSASTFEDDDLSNMTRDSWDLHMEANLRAPIKLAQDFAAQFPDKDSTPSGTQIINLIDQRVWKLTPQFLSYTVSKAALMTMTRTLAQTLGPFGIRVNAIGPGPTMRNVRQSEEDWQQQNQATILGHGATPDDIVGAMRYLINAKAVTGQMIAVDGGQHLAWQTPDVMINE